MHHRLLVNFYLRLHRHLFATGALPASYGWGRRAEGQANVHTGLALDDMIELSRVSINRFWQAYEHMIPPASKYAMTMHLLHHLCRQVYSILATPPYIRCLEHPPLYYSVRTVNCSESWTIEYEGDREKWHADHQNKKLYIDMSKSGVGKVLPGYFDAVISTQAMQYFEPHESAAGIAMLLKHNGLLMITVPFMEKQAPEWPDW